MKNFSIIIPSYNEEERIEQLLKSIVNLDYPKENFEVIVVDDGSTDATKEVVNRFDFVKLISLSTNQGRFLARKIGSQNATYVNLFFLDSKVVVDSKALKVLNANNVYKVMIGHCLEANKLSPFETFYKGIRKKIFPDISKSIVELSSTNFDKYPKGTGVLFVKKEVWKNAVNQFKNTDTNISDDTKLLFSISKEEKIAINPDLKITYYGRSNFLKSIDHLFNRGIKFVDYYLNPKKRNFWLVIIFPPFFFFLFVILFLISSLDILIKILLTLSLYLLLVLFLSYNIKSFLNIFYIMPLIVITFYSGIVKGILLKIFSRENE